ncbi:Trm112 family protein [Candidatus Woesearchaeota archaeon]|nr:Trm112 family protein [Candidatus Woesearchaeota archaeon]
MLNKKLLKILACPACKSGLKQSQDSLSCSKCKKVYKIKKGIPIFI